MPDKEIMLQIKALDDQRPYRALDAMLKAAVEGGEHDDAWPLREALAELAGDCRMLADLYERAKLKGAKTTYIDPLRITAMQLDKVIKGLEQPRRPAPGELRPTSAPPAHTSAGLDEPRHRFIPGDPGSPLQVMCTAIVERGNEVDGSVLEPCGRFASHPAHRLDGPTERPSLDALIAEASGPAWPPPAGATVSRSATGVLTIDGAEVPDFPGQVSGDEVSAYLRGDADDIAGLPPLADLPPSTVRDMTEPAATDVEVTFTGTWDGPAPVTSAKELKERANVQPTPTTPPVPLLGQPGDAGSGYSPTYVPPGGVPLTFVELLTPVPYAFLPPHLSHSQIDTLADCPTKYRAQRLDSVPREGGPVIEIPQWALIGGTAFHAAVEEIERTVIANPDADPLPLPAANAGGLWRTHFEAECAKIEQSSPVPRSRWRASKQGAEGETWWNANGPEMLRRYLAARSARPTATLPRPGDPHGALQDAIELELTAAVPTNYGPIDYRAVIDRVTWDAARNAYVIEDYKTGDRMPGDTSQLGEYANVLRLLGVPPHVKIFGTFFNARKGTWTPEVDLSVWSAEWFTYLVTTGHAQRLALTQGPTPARPSSFCGGCAVRWACPIKGVGRP